jgi:nitrite reductase/ring-hydroxylating ferredoxin subunit
MATPRAAITPDSVQRDGPWALGDRDGELFAVSRRCRHQLADLSRGHLDPSGCLVCPWHQAAYDVRTGTMVRGPRGFLVYRGPTPGYSALIKAVGRALHLRVGKITETADGVTVR